MTMSANNTAPDVVRGVLSVRIADASGVSKTQNGLQLWDPAFTEGFIKVEIRGGARTVKAQTKMYRVRDGAIQFREELKLEVLQGATELRLLLCKEKRTTTRISSSTVAACGIYVNDILEAVPIDKYFELFKTRGDGGDGGYIRISMDFHEDRRAVSGGRELLMEHSLSLRREVAAGSAAARGQPKRGGFPWKLLLIGAVAAAAVGVGLVLKQEGDKKPANGAQKKKPAGRV